MKRLDLSWLTGTQIVIVVGFCMFVDAAIGTRTGAELSLLIPDLAWEFWEQQ